MSSSELEDILKQRRNFCEVEPNRNIMELQAKLIAIEKEMQRVKSENVEKDKLRKAFRKRQNKFYCQQAWAQLAAENRQDE